MIHQMKLCTEPFTQIKNKTKTIEMRLCDEKRSIICIGDMIAFTNIVTNETCMCEVTNLYKYENFDELYKHHNKIAIGYADHEIADPNDMLMYYSAEKIKEYGVIGIEIIVK